MVIFNSILDAIGNTPMIDVSNLNLLSMKFFKLTGVMLLIDLPTIRLPLTIERDRGDDENFSRPSPFLERFNSVAETERDFLENISADTIITPDPTNHAEFATTGSDNLPI